MKKSIRIDNWQLAWVENKELKERGVSLTTSADVEASGYKTIKASVPGNFELDFMREGLLEDVYYGANSVKTQALENLHLYYFTKFTYKKETGYDSILSFEGIDTVAEIYLDGKKLGFVENMHHAHRFNLKDVCEGEHDLLVHILPVCIYAREFDVPTMCFALKYNQDTLQVRKSGSMFGWDIMPRIVSAGLWKPVQIEYLPKARIENPFLYAATADKESAFLYFSMKIRTEEDFIKGYTVLINGKCGDSVFHEEYHAYSAAFRHEFAIENPLLWWPKNYGEPNLYDIEIILMHGDVECDRVTYKTGIRTIWLKRTSRSGDDGEFCFIVNGKKIFVLGTNWVPCDAFPSRHDDYVLRNLELVNDLNCNMIRCWGGNTYPSELLYDYCDAHGIMIWQDFSLGCGHYPDDERLCRLVKEEVKEIAIAKRNHPSLVLWAGDNECDSFVVPYVGVHWTDDDPPAMLDPNMNRLTRDTIPRELRNHDATRPYLPSSPYLDALAYRYGKPSEDHLWGPRDFFKGKYYGTAECHFASEIGYHGCPSPKSIERFISPEQMPKDSIYDICDKEDWLIHAAGMETCVEGNPYAYRLPLMIRQVERIFGEASKEMDTFARQSQISQAEAKKFFIESFRAQKWRKTGILWWNIIDGWPQVSDAVVDWYGCKKLAYSYIKRSQTPFCMLFAEPINGVLDLRATNDSREVKKVDYTVENIATGEILAKGTCTVAPDEIVTVAQVPEKKGGFYVIRWQDGKEQGVNHFVCDIGNDWTYEQYKSCMQKAGFYSEFEGF